MAKETERFIMDGKTMPPKLPAKKGKTIPPPPKLPKPLKPKKSEK